MITTKLSQAVLAVLVAGIALTPDAWGQGRPPQRRSPASMAAMAEVIEEELEIDRPVGKVRRVSAAAPRTGSTFSSSEQQGAMHSRSSRPALLGTTKEYINTQVPADGMVFDQPTHEVPGESYFDEGTFAPGGSCGPDGCGSCGPGCGGCGHCWHCLHLPICFPIFRLQNLEIFAGAHGFTGPANRGGTGSFGFQEGVNWGGSLPFLHNAVSLQAGGMVTQSNFNGSNFTLDDRHQVFVTGGLFRRADHGLQGGVVFDYMHDDWYYKVDLSQLRGELSWVFDCSHELGVWFTAGFDDQRVSRQFRTAQVPNGARVFETFEVNDIMAFFYRQQLMDGGEGRIWGGFTGHGDGLVGAEFRLPLATCVDLQTDFTYLIPQESVNNNGLNEETWNISMNLVWYPGCQRRCGSKYDRPLFNVANNGNFLVDRR